MNEQVITVLGFIVGGFLFMFAQILDIKLTEWKERKENELNR